MYSMVNTRPYISYSISVLSMFMSDPRKQHLEAMKWLIRYIKGFIELGLVYKKNNKKIWLDFYTLDYDYAGI